MAKDKLLLIDGNSVAFKAFFALYNSLSRFTNEEGLHTNAIYGFNTMLELMLNHVEPTKVLVAFDAGKTTFRTKMYSDYKAGRAKTPSEFSEQMPYIKDLLTSRGIKTYELKIMKQMTSSELWRMRLKRQVFKRRLLPEIVI